MTKRWSVRFAGTGALVLLGAACASTHSEKIDDSRLAGVPQDQMQPVTTANAEISRAKEDLQAAKQAKIDADNRLKLAKSEEDVAKAQFDQAKTQFELQQKTAQAAQEAPYQTPQPNEPAAPPPPAPRALVTPDAYHEARLNYEAAQAKVKYLDKLDDVASDRITVAEKKVDLGNAKLEQARYQVLNGSSPAETQAMNLNAEQFDALVQGKQADVSKAEATVAEASADARVDYQKWAATRSPAQRVPERARPTRGGAAAAARLAEQDRALLLRLFPARQMLRDACRGASFSARSSWRCRRPVLTSPPPSLCSSLPSPDQRRRARLRRPPRPRRPCR